MMQRLGVVRSHLDGIASLGVEGVKYRLSSEMVHHSYHCWFYVFIMRSREEDWASAVSYFHGKGAAPRRPIRVGSLGFFLSLLVIVTVFALVLEVL